MRSAKLSATPRAIATSFTVRSLVTCGSFALVPERPGVSVPKVTVSSGSSAMVFIANVRARLNSPAGPSVLAAIFPYEIAICAVDLGSSSPKQR